MGFSQAVASCFNQYVTFSGRAARSEYWYWVLFCVLAWLIIGLLGGMIFHGDAEKTDIISGLFSLLTFLPGLAVSVRRLHDINRSGWWLLIVFIPIIGFFVLLFWYCKKGTDGTNRFGADPLAKGALPGI